MDGKWLAALWPEHKPLAEVLELQATTPENIWSGTYQGVPTAPGGATFRRDWFRDRFDAGKPELAWSCVARWLSFDTALKDREDSDYSACAVGELWPDYRMALREVWRGKPIFPDLPVEIERLARRHNHDGKLRGVIIEDKASGTSAYQTLLASAPQWLRGLLIAFMPQGDKEYRANQAGVWCKNGSVQLPAPSEHVPWLIDFEDELFTFPQSQFDDQVDSFSQLVIYCENLLAEGFRLRGEYAKLAV